MKQVSTTLDVFMAKVRQAKECPLEKRTPAQKKLLNFAYNGETLTNIFKNGKSSRARKRK